MAEIKDFTCRACGAQFDTRDRLDQHNRREHGAQAQQGGYGDSGTQKGGGGGGGGQQQNGQQGSQAGESSDWDEEG